MSGSENPWSGSPNAPQISYLLYHLDKGNFVGDSIAAILYGVIIVLFFQCIGASFDPLNRARSRGIKWGLVTHTTVMFLLVTVATAMGLNLQSISHIDNREFLADQFPPGPIGYKFLIYSKAISLVPNLTFQLNQWLADGLLLYRCYVIYAMNYWVVAFPCLMYLTSLATGIVYMYQSSVPGNILVNKPVVADLGLSYFTVSFSLNILLTSMIVTRLVLHRRNIRNAMGTSAGVGQLYGAIITILVESSALYAVSFLLFLVPWAADSWVDKTFWFVLFEVQVIAPLLITRRIASRSALTSDVIVSGHPSSIQFRSQGESTGGDETLSDDNPTSSTDAHGEIFREPGAGVEITIDKFAS